jgi:hypothetical protein
MHKGKSLRSSIGQNQYKKSNWRRELGVPQLFQDFQDQRESLINWHDSLANKAKEVIKSGFLYKQEDKNSTEEESQATNILNEYNGEAGDRELQMQL